MYATKHTSRWVTAATSAAAILLAAGCSSGTASQGEDFSPCIVSDAAGFDDHSFNESALRGITAAADELGVVASQVESGNENDFQPNVDAQVAEGCDLVVTVGYLFADVTGAAAVANPDVQFAIVDDALDADGDGRPDVENGKPILFDTAQAAFLAGYTAAAYSKSGVVGTLGGGQIPPVTLFMDGFVDGVDHYDEVNGADVRAVGWDKESQTGVFTGGFEAGVEAKTAAQSLLDQGADVLLPVGGPIYQSAAEAIRDKGGDTALIGVDADVYETDPSVADLLLTSVVKGVDEAVRDVTVSAASGEFRNAPYVGTLENDGVGIAPFHDFAGKVPADLQQQLDDLAAQIIAGEIEVTSQSTPG
ncbi:BMP family lipoprotein [Myceligenerans indicum]|uniref:BMP family lipoprotein n=1 Tax=Myceligenerans indicum TaxID=2593663 RepID=UPI0027DB4B06|nr:BMP family ABC transporter substrate-binding protein [Myceligenerans indicum]